MIFWPKFEVNFYAAEINKNFKFIILRLLGRFFNWKFYSLSLSLVIRGQCDQMARMYIQYFAI